MGVGGQHRPLPQLFYRPQERPGTPCTGGWVDLGASLDGMVKLLPTGLRTPDQSALASCYTD
jgi:hypothetical protein